MAMTLSAHPFERWPRRHRSPSLWIVGVLALLPMVVMFLVTPLSEDEPGGENILSFEFASSAERAREILATWRAAGVLETAKIVQLLDFGYPVVYGAALAGCCIAAGHAMRNAGWARIAAASAAMAWVAFAAAGFDYIENIGLDISLWYRPVDPWPLISSVAAGLKFLGVGATIVYALCGLAARVKGPRAAGAPPVEAG